MPAQTTSSFPYHTPAGASFTLIEVKGGSFSMGSDEYKDEQPVHTVKVPPFWLGQHQVTQELWEAVMGPGSNPSRFKGKTRPVEQVSWYDAAVFCNALNELCGYEPCYFNDKAFRNPYGKTSKGYGLPNSGEVLRKPGLCGYRLPTEAEWEYAARGGPEGDKRPRYEYAGGDKLDEVGWYNENSHGETKPVGLKLANELGIYDMSGNIWEWCEDQYHGNYEGAPADGSAWVDREAGADRVFRGGSWLDAAVFCRCAYRRRWHPGIRRTDVGFRLLWVSPPVPPEK